MSYIGNQPTYAAFVTDQFSGNGGVTFTMSVAPANTASVLVAVSGVLQDPSTYSVNGLTLTFSQAPPVGTANISVRYMGIPASGVTNTAYRTVTEFTATNAQTTFNVPSYTVGFINVYLNGVRLGASDFTASNGTTVVLASGAPTGALVTTESFYVSSVLNAIPATAGAVNSTYINNGAITQDKLAANVASNGPAFSAYLGAAYMITSATFTKLKLDTKYFDTNNNFDTTAYRFTPTIAGYYWIETTVLNNGAGSPTRLINLIYKNGTQYGKFTQDQVTGYSATGGKLIYLNGSTDYVELYGYMVATTPEVSGAEMHGYLVRAA